MTTSLLLTNARVHRSAHDTEPAEAVLIEGGRIAWTGPRTAAPDAAAVRDLGGRVMLPGLTDAHLHVFMLALSRLQVSFARTPVHDFAALVRALREAPGGGWVLGCDLMEDRLAERRLPDRTVLDAAFPDRPVLLRRYCGHVAILNGAALGALGLGEGTADPEGGRFHRAADGTLTGIAEETAAERVFRAAPGPSADRMSAGISAVIADCAALGLTSLVEAAVGFSIGYDREAEVWAAMRGGLGARMGFMLQLEAGEAAARGLVAEWGEEWSAETLKFFADGIIGGRSGAVSIPYDDSGGLGMLIQPEGVLERQFADAQAAGWRIAVHATGDRAVARAAAAMRAAQGDGPRRRHRIEHCFVPPEGIFADLARAEILTVMQPGFLDRMGGSIAAALGARTARAYPGASVLAAGAPLAFSSDAPTGPLSPWVGIRAAIDRIGGHGGAIGPDEALDRSAALDAYIGGGARAMRHEGFRGQIAAGQAADLAVLDVDVFAAPPDELADTRAVLTLRGGEIVHDDGI